MIFLKLFLIIIAVSVSYWFRALIPLISAVHWHHIWTYWVTYLTNSLLVEPAPMPPPQQTTAKYTTHMSDYKISIISVYRGQYLSKVIQGRNSVVSVGQGHGLPRFTDVCGEQRFSCMVQIIAHSAEKCNAGSVRKVSECTLHYRLLFIGLHCRRPVRVSMVTTVNRRKHRYWSNRRRCPRLMNHIFFYTMSMAGCVCASLTLGTPVTRVHHG